MTKLAKFSDDDLVSELNQRFLTNPNSFKDKALFKIGEDTDGGEPMALAWDEWEDIMPIGAEDHMYCLLKLGNWPPVEVIRTAAGLEVQVECDGAHCGQW